MKVSKSMSDMTIDPEKIITQEDTDRLFGRYKSYSKLVEEVTPMEGMGVVNLCKYVVLLYSEDSFLNQNPPLRFDERQTSAGKIAGLPRSGQGFADAVKSLIFDLQDKEFFNFTFEYLIRNRNHLWQDIITLETQMLENQKLRLRPVEEETGKNELDAFKKKDDLMKMYKVWRKQLEEYYDELYGDNERIRTIHKMNRANMAVIENYATL